ncbi:MAG: phage late control D family protein [Sphingomonas sp.]|nr:phage late control D family protein [Sphingomonas sp.]
MNTERRANIADFRVSVDGVDFTDRARPRLVSLSITEKRGGEADQIDLMLDDSDRRLAIPKKGALIRVQLGWRQGSDVTPGLVDKGRFTADEVSWSGPPDQLAIRGRSADLTAAFRQRKEAAHKATTLGALAQKVAAAHGLEARVAPELAGIEVAIIEQHGTSDMALLRRLGREHDAVATVKDRKLILSPIGSGKAPGGAALPSLTLGPSDGDRYSYREIDRSGEAGAEARYHDVDTGERSTVKAGGGGSGTPRRVRKIHHSKAAAAAAAKAEAGRAARGAAEFDMQLALGRADLYPEQRVTLAGFKPEADARKWIIAEVSHRLDRAGGFTTSIKLETK